ncbi:hypothetical protein GQX73_g2655 [Xylaria multiplex]|uniref:Thioesterase domain-containing protein n=1 Tax=Xylaria multiplex TaxID=323545 RepID=A0A7C8J514_9PEZI|nr:hypothetical protein GQX73_g2655 [Xylaria multiplex]
MLRSSQHLCAQVLSRPNGRSKFRENISSSCLRAILQAQLHSFRAFLLQNPQPRYFTTSHPFLSDPSKPSPQDREQQTPTTTTAPATTTDIGVYPHNVSPSPESQRPKRPRRGLYYATLFLLLGAAAGTLVRITIAPPELPTLGSEKDIYLQARIQAQGAALPVVQQLSTDPAWMSWEAYAGIPTTTDSQGVSTAQSTITSGPMSGSSGLAFQRIFHNTSTGEVVTVVYFGAGLAGWPGIVHGGAIATILDESLGRCAILRFPSRTGVTANLEMQYRFPTLTNNFYVIRAIPVASDDDDVVGEDGIRKGDRKVWVRGTLETEKGKVAVRAKGLFVVPKAYKLRPLVEGF